jgi:hypothetical protein
VSGYNEPSSGSIVQTFVVSIGTLFLFMAIAIGLIFANPRNGLLALGILMFGVVVTVGVVMLMVRQHLPVKTITVTKADGTTETYTGRVRTKHYLECPECGKQFTGSSIGSRGDGGIYYRDPDRDATKRLRLHLTHIHRYERLQAGKTARTAPFKYEESPA